MAFCMRETDGRDLNAESRKHNSCSKPKGCLSLMRDLESEFRAIRMPQHTVIKIKTDRRVMSLNKRDKTIVFMKGKLTEEPAEQDLRIRKKESYDTSKRTKIRML